MEVGYFTMPLHPAGTDYTQSLDEDLEQIVVLDRLGFREAWIGEHFTAAWENIPAPDLLIAKAIPLTKNIILGTGVSCLPNHDPFVLAHRIAMLDHLAKGRFYWGVGAGSFIGDFEAFCIDPKTGEHRDLTNRSLDLILNLWNDPEPGIYENRRWRFSVPKPQRDVGLGVHIKPYQKPHPPIAVAGITEGSGTLRIAGERGWIPMSINFATKDVLRTHWASVEEGAMRSGKTADRSRWRIARDIYVGETTEDARRDAREGTLARDFTDYFFKIVPRIRGNLDIFKIDKTMPDSDVTPDYMMDNLWIVGDPDHVVERINELYNYVGGFGVLLAMGHEWKPKDKWIRSMRLLAEEVMPRLRELG
ncbi:MAG TPA: LLM class flavin-dependent oxidoreductase [Thermodesulfobacteriota bacterium]|jgi:alkanesulfonate monooxygenase SsuD/methylene tetrahydromethanopterin reductase-like flavin-dependent oxidoreductase (luciferase family)|nr:LLM class flavin-dependent oxidoreductase [Thermodesulfobacteriota bacterium]